MTFEIASEMALLFTALDPRLCSRPPKTARSYGDSEFSAMISCATFSIIKTKLTKGKAPQNGQFATKGSEKRSFYADNRATNQKIPGKSLGEQ
jgi:hypothetical protein